jgi:hypothetical protein
MGNVKGCAFAAVFLLAPTVVSAQEGVTCQDFARSADQGEAFALYTTGIRSGDDRRSGRSGRQPLKKHR